jgi:beta-glucosidase/6-phospho-beta-glucosidase/beta-galactosidase
MSALLVGRACRQGLPFRETLTFVSGASDDTDAGMLRDTDCLRGHTHVSFINDNFNDNFNDNLNDNSHNKFSNKSDCDSVSCHNSDNIQHCNDSGHNLVHAHTQVVCHDIECNDCNIIYELSVDYDVEAIKDDYVSSVCEQDVNIDDICNTNVIGDVFDGHANLCEQSHSHIPVYDINSCITAHRLIMFKGINMYDHGVVSDGNLY